MSSKITFATWNINGTQNKILGDKTKNKDFVNTVSNIDFMFLTETWNNEPLTVPGFEIINSKPTDKLTNGELAFRLKIDWESSAFCNTILLTITALYL